MDLQTVILIGPSGCGKGTQATMLQEYLKAHDPEHPTKYLQSGSKFRDFIQGDTYTQKKIKEVVSNGGLSPGFLAVWIWSSMFVEQMEGNEHIIIDGFPRSVNEPILLHSAFEFYGRVKPTVISFEIDDAVIIERLVNGRKRADDTPEKVAERLRWFRRDVALSIKFFEEHPYYNVAHIQGDQTPEEVFRDIRTALQLPA